MKNLLVYAILLIGWQLSAQPTHSNKYLAEIADPSSNAHWVRFKATQNLDPLLIFELHKEAFNLSKDDHMTLLRSETDAYGYQHHRFQQYYKGLMVEACQYNVHQDTDGRVFAANGDVATGISLDVQPVYTEQQALAKALQSMSGKSLAWEDPEAESRLKHKKNDLQATNFPTGDLLIIRQGDPAVPTYFLAWKFVIRTLPSQDSRMVYVDAHTGELVEIDKVMLDCNPTSGPTIFNGVQNFGTQQTFVMENDGTVRLSWSTRNDCGPGPECWVFNPVTDWFHFRTENDQWSDPGLNQTFWGLRQTSDFFYNTYGRNSFDGTGGHILANYPVDLWGAFWDRNGHELYLGNGNSPEQNDDFNTLDILGHELMHGLTEFSSGLNYNGESGAINESFSDIFGEMVERYVTGTHDWLVGAQRGPALRSFVNPNSERQPDTYGGQFWFNQAGCVPVENNDRCGVHTNSGVQNYWFYLLCNNTVGINDHGFPFKVSGIGIDAAAAVAYLTVTHYLYPTANYDAARQASINASIELFGLCAWQTKSIIDAWDAVGVYGNQYCGCFPDIHLVGEFTTPYNDVESESWIHTRQQIKSGQTVFYDATTEVSLWPGFEAEAGSNFVAFIDGCGGNHRGGYLPDTDNYFKTSQVSERPLSARMPATFDLMIEPNPFSSGTTISFVLAEDQEIGIRIFNAVGDLVSTLLPSKTGEAGEYHLSLDTRLWPPGIYFLVAQSGDQRVTKRMVVTQ